MNRTNTTCEPCAAAATARPAAAAREACIELAHASFAYAAPPAAPDTADAAEQAAAVQNTARALDDLSLAIYAGEYVCVLGANGSGKSTLLALLGALETPTAGTVRIFGLDAADPVSAAAIRRRTATVFQHPDDQMVASIVADDVAFGPENLGIPQPEIARRVDAALEAVDMADLAQADPADLSGGQRQRVAIAGALAMEPEVLLLDEPSAMLDARGRHAIQGIVQRLAARGITIVHVTHFMDDALSADRVIVLEQGRIALDGTPDEVFAHRSAIQALGLELPFTMRLTERLEATSPGWRNLPRTADRNALAGAIAARLAAHGARTRTAQPAVAPGEATPCGPEPRPRSEHAAPAPEAATSSEQQGMPLGRPADARTPQRTDAAKLAFHRAGFSYALPTRAGGRLPRGPLATWRSARVRRIASQAPRALDQASFTVPRGSLTALIGHTGSGKSTAVELACALKLPCEGTVEVAGIDTADRAHRRALRAQVGYVSQFPERQLFAETVYDDIAFGPRNLGLQEDEVRERVIQALADLGLAASDDLLGRSPFALSGGQRRSVALAGVLALRTPLLVLDEPMAGLDPAGRTAMRALVRRLHAQGTTILLVTHDMDDVAELADQVVALARGHVIAEGTPHAVFGVARAQASSARDGSPTDTHPDIPGPTPAAPAAQAARADEPRPHTASIDAPALLPGLPEPLVFARLLAAQGITLPHEPLTLDELVAGIEEVARVAAR